MDNEKFGVFVSRLRKERGMTQKELADRLFISDKAVSKWERGLSLPDISLLQPLADILSVSVTELLSGEYIRDEPDAQETEQLVQSVVVQLTKQEEETQRQNRRRWGRIYAVCLLCEMAETLLFWRLLFDPAVVFMVLPPFLAAVFGIHFCFLATEKLPTFYDQYRIDFYSEGAFRMNVPGVRFNNSNWPHILHALRIWCAVTMALWIPAYAVLHGIALILAPVEYTEYAAPFIQLFLFFPAFFGGLFGPVYVVGRKYE
ncbi:MAG: helix-turn-helix domain-containing protein [Oscillospiraceae bacterium]|nr:helix-turn-helix domain-containing protein [Oscillospiraceae bacterium]